MPGKVGLDFCPLCRLYIGPPRPFRIRAEDFLAPGDRDVTDNLREVKFLGEIVNRSLMVLQRPLVWNALLKGCSRLDPRHPAWSLSMKAAAQLCLDKAPRMFLCRNGGSIFTIGSNDDPSIIIGQSALENIGVDELEAILAHENAHIKARHVEYFTLLRLFLDGFLVMTGSSLAMNLIVDLLLKKWRRSAELSADRGAIIATGDPSSMKSALLKLHRRSSLNGEMKLRDLGYIEGLARSLKSHPNLKDRVNALEFFYRSEDYRETRRKVEKNKEIREILKDGIVDCNKYIYIRSRGN
ncbi:MAG: M48 family metalloprotease [Candidatus Bathyarchaeia archaeon]